jgi:L-lactate dehydrogenase complex protein LldG
MSETKFAAALEAAGGVFDSARRPDEAVLKIMEIARALSARRLIFKYSDMLKEAGIDGLLQSRGLQVAWAANEKEELFASDIGVSEAEAGIAESGSLIEIMDPERGDLVSLVPPVHVAVLRRERIVETLETFLESFATSPRPVRPPQRMTIVTGPSRTADIEQSLTLGVHGPGKLFVIVVGSD